MRHVRAKLSTFSADRIPIDIVRRGLGKRVETIEGIVAAVGGHWVVIAKLVDHTHDGWEVLRIRDISEIHKPDTDRLAFIKRVMTGTGYSTEPPPNLHLPVDLHWRDELIFVLSTDDLVGIYEELGHPDAVRIGMYTGTNRKYFSIRQIRTTGRWDEEHALIKSSKTTRIAIGGRYQGALSQYGDPIPLDL